ncbi:hypothetical protein E4198_08890 [Streptomyces sp. RKND-216]|uniref:hypothetical protein n=1 Tax=Streptomyces sp. RKND-216 TaxID=2562581 RepID=UPI00109E0C28|nr:hypothetical protein [Streptomyces sp. RKND-216]THA24834.1 hypothetical protein E4198_08890 [Streptomyces sp. RKND-216]
MKIIEGITEAPPPANAYNVTAELVQRLLYSNRVPAEAAQLVVEIFAGQREPRLDHGPDGHDDGRTAQAASNAVRRARRVA